MERIPENEQWKLRGDCSVCRRNKYCKKGCTLAKRRQKEEVHNLVFGAINEATGGAFGKIMDSLNHMGGDKYV